MDFLKIVNSAFLGINVGLFVLNLMAGNLPFMALAAICGYLNYRTVVRINSIQNSGR